MHTTKEIIKPTYISDYKLIAIGQIVEKVGYITYLFNYLPNGNQLIIANIGRFNDFLGRMQR